jgi:hypothetical protein
LEIGASEQLRERRPVLLRKAGDDKVPILGRKDAIDAAEEGVPAVGAPLGTAAEERERQLAGLGPDLAAKEGAVDALAAAGLLSREKGRKDAHANGHAAGAVGDDRARWRRELAVLPGSRHQAANRLTHEIDAFSPAVGAEWAEPRGSGIDEARISA